MRKLLITAFALLAFAAGSQARTNDKNTKNMKTIALTKADFLKKVADYEKNPQEWKYLGDKPALIDFYASWCGPCKATERDVFSKKEVGDFMDEYFVAAKYDIDKPTGKALAGKHGIRSIPTYLVFNTEGDLLGKITGSMPAEEFSAALRKIIAETGKK